MNIFKRTERFEEEDTTNTLDLTKSEDLKVNMNSTQIFLFFIFVILARLLHRYIQLKLAKCEVNLWELTFGECGTYLL